MVEARRPADKWRILGIGFELLWKVRAWSRSSLAAQHRDLSLEGGNTLAQPVILLARFGCHFFDGLKLLALHHIHVAQDLLALRPHHRLELALHALCRTGGVGHQLR